MQQLGCLPLLRLTPQLPPELLLLIAAASDDAKPLMHCLMLTRNFHEFYACNRAYVINSLTTVKITKCKTEYKLCSLLHREDGPAVVHANDLQEWYRYGQLHRLDGPAVVYTDGLQLWYQNGKMHRWDGPATEYVNGMQAWLQHEELYQLDRPQ